MKVILLLSLVFTCTWTIDSYLDTPPDPPIYPPRWAATAHFQFINASNNLPVGAGVLYQTTKAYRWNCATDVVTWFIDTAAVDGRLIYQHTLPQPLFDVYQDLWFTNYTVIVEEIDRAVFIPPKGWNCPNYESAQSVKHTFSIMLPVIPILLYTLNHNYIN
ncbi:unnamed protein product [Rotaria sp. Silwood1]|nr:unnamed protein product [Rotaria sp. Silwood1]CAF4827275.1 unnamed protein product [Rotaria sp. Silwood1]